MRDSGARDGRLGDAGVAHKLCEATVLSRKGTEFSTSSSKINGEDGARGWTEGMRGQGSQWQAPLGFIFTASNDSLGRRDALETPESTALLAQLVCASLIATVGAVAAWLRGFCILRS